MNKYIIFGLYMLLIPLVSATDYYVSNSGDDASTTGNITNPYQTITKVNSLTFKAGDNVYFNRGDVWRTTSDAYLICDSGNATANLTYDAYGTGNKPLFIGSYNLSSTSDWNDMGSNIWNSTGTFTTDIGELLFNGSVISTARRSTKAGLSAQDNYHYNFTTDKIYVYSVGNPASVHSSIEAFKKTQVVDFQSESYVVIKNLDVRYSGSAGLVGTATRFTYLYNNSVSFIGGSYISESDTTRYGNCIDFECTHRDSVISYNDVNQCYDAGITTQSYLSCSGGSTNMSNIEFSYNIIRNSHYGYEYFSSNTSSYVSNIVIKQNTFIMNGGGVWAVSSGNQNDAYCLMGNRNPSSSSGHSWIDNICYNTSNSGSAGDAYYVSIGRGSSTYWLGNAPEVNYNIFTINTETNKFEWNGTYYTNISTFNTGAGQCANCLDVEPYLNSTTFKPSWNSSACNMSSTGSYVGALPCEDAPTIDCSLKRVITCNTIGCYFETTLCDVKPRMNLIYQCNYLSCS